MNKYTHTSLYAGCLSALLAGVALAGEPGKEVVVPVEDPKTFCEIYEGIFSHAKIYADPGNPFVQEVKFTGRYHGQYHNIESDLGDDSDWENRRFRLGMDAKLLDLFTFKSSFNMRTDFSNPNRFVRNVDEMTISWDKNDFVSAWVGKAKPILTRDWTTSSNRIKTIERNILTNNLIVDKAWGGVVTFKDLFGFTASVGAFAGAVDTDWAWADFESGYALNASIGHALTANSEIRLDYVYNDGDVRNNQFRRFEHSFSLNTQSDWDRFHLYTDLVFATGIGAQEDIYGVVIEPYYNITDKLEGVFRYTYAGADSEIGRGINLQSREERKTVDGASLRADEYHGFYGGLNYYICGDKLKLMNGVEYSVADGATDADFWTFWSGVRLYF